MNHFANATLAGYDSIDGVANPEVGQRSGVRRRWDRRRALVRRVGRGSYAAYVLHPPVLVLASMATRPLPLASEGKFVLVAAVGMAASFTLGAALTWRRVVVHVERPRVA